MLKFIVAISIIIFFNMKELSREKSRGKALAVYFSIIGICLILGILINIDKKPTSPIIVLLNWSKAMGWEDG